MKNTNTLKVMSILAVLMVVTWVWAAVPSPNPQENHAGHDHSGHVEQADEHAGHDHAGETHEDGDDMHAAHEKLSKKIPTALAAIDKATTAVKFGDKKTALAELTRLKKLITEIQKDLESHGPAFLNTRCPMMGKEIIPAKVTPALTRTYKGQKIAFCCAGCLPQWDALSAIQKAAKLKTLSSAKSAHDPSDGGDHSGHVH